MMSPFLDEALFITEEAEAERVAVGYEFEPLPISYTMRLRDVLEGLSDAELVLRPGEIADQERVCKQKRQFPVDWIAYGIFHGIAIIYVFN
jgi:hypothetical protein